MTAVHHDLAHELPEFRDQIHTLKLSNAHFAKLFDQYHVLNREVLRLEGEGIPLTDEAFETLKKQRLQLKDELYSMLQSA